MSTVSIPNQIQAGQPLDPRPVMANFAALASFINDDVLTLDGSKAMTGHLTLSGPGTAGGHAVTKAQLDNAVGSDVAGGGFLPLAGGTITGNLTVSGTFRAATVQAGGSGGLAVTIGDDVALHDVNVPNTLGVYGVQNPLVGSLRLGSAGPLLSGAGGALRVDSNLYVGDNFSVFGINVEAGFLRTANGDWSWPSHTFTNDPQTGFYLATHGTAGLRGNLLLHNRALFQNGEVQHPSLAFADDPATGIYRYGAGIVSISANGVSAGNFGQAGVAFPTVPYVAGLSRNVHIDTASGALVRTDAARFGDGDIEKLVKLADNLSAKVKELSARVEMLEGQKGL